MDARPRGGSRRRRCCRCRRCRCWSSSSGLSWRRAARSTSAPGRPTVTRRRAGRARGGPVRAPRRRRGRGRTPPPRRTCAGRRTAGRPHRLASGARCITTWVCAGRGAVGIGEQQLAAHAQVDHQRRRRCRASPTRYLPRRSTAMIVVPVRPSIRPWRGPPHRALAADLHRLDAPPDDPVLQAAADGLDLGQLRHGGPARHRSRAHASAARGLLGHLLRPALARPRRPRRRRAPWRRSACRGRAPPR